MIQAINLKSLEDVRQLNSHATNFDYDIFVHGSNKSEFIDAKSILGLTSLINKENLRLVFPDNINKKILLKGIENLLI